MTQRAVPTSDVADVGAVRWSKSSGTTFWELIDDYAGGGAPDDDTTNISHPGDNTLASYIDVGLSAISDPGVYAQHLLTAYMKIDGPGTFATPARVELRDASANVFASFNLNPTTSWAARASSLNSTQAQAISAAAAYGSLIVRLVAPGQGDGATRIRISAVKFEAPDVAPSIGFFGFVGMLALGHLLAAQVSISAGMFGLLGRCAPDTNPVSPFLGSGVLGLIGTCAAGVIAPPTPPDPGEVGCEGQLLRGGSVEGELRHGESAQGEALRGGSEEGQLTRC